ncbi:MAG: virulence factor SrfB [Lewinellaceae bacterium]|nr:virulence factor SrfB [Lewinellaceae bacterium]
MTAQTQTYEVQSLIGFDTRTFYEKESYENEDLNETPIFESEYDKSKDFVLCNNEFSLVDFCSKLRNCDWVDEYILKLFHPNVKDIDELKIKSLV